MFFWNCLAFSMIQQMLAIWSLVPLPFLKPAWTSGSSRFTYAVYIHTHTHTHIYIYTHTHTHTHIYICVCAKSLQLCPTLCNPMDCSPPGSSVHRILQTGVLERVTMPSSRGSFQPRDGTRVSYVSCIGRLALYYYIKPFLSVKFSGIKHIHKVV